MEEVEKEENPVLSVLHHGAMLSACIPGCSHSQSPFTPFFLNKMSSLRGWLLLFSIHASSGGHAGDFLTTTSH